MYKSGMTSDGFTGTFNGINLLRGGRCKVLSIKCIAQNIQNKNTSKQITTLVRGWHFGADLIVTPQSC